MSETNQAGAPDIIGATSDHPATRILRAIESMRVSNEERLGNMQKLLDAAEARIRAIEARPASRYVSQHEASMEHRKALCEWIRDNYRFGKNGTQSAMQWRAEQVGDSNSEGGYLVPVPLLPEVIRIVESYGVARRICRVMPMDRDKLDLTSKATGPTIRWQSSQGNTTTATGATFGRSQLATETMLCLDEIALQLEDDASIDVVSFLVDLFGEGVAAEEDRQCFNSTSPFTGLLQTSNTGVHTIASTAFTGNLVYNDFVTTMFKASAFVARRGTWLMSSDVFCEIMKIKTTDGTPLFSNVNPGNLSGGQPGTILGRPVEVSEVMPGYANDGANKPVFAYGDFRMLILGDRKRFSVDFSDDAGFENATRKMRVMERMAVAIPVPTAFAICKTHS